jgi:membrane protease YdiL (CAAX protease family)
MRRRHCIGALQHRRRSQRRASCRLEQLRAHAPRWAIPTRRDRRLQRLAASEGARIMHLLSHLGRATLDNSRMHGARGERIGAISRVARSASATGSRSSSGSSISADTKGVGSSRAGIRLEVIVQAVVVGMIVMLAGTLPRNFLFAANLKYFTSVPWAVPVTAVYLFFFWRYLDGAGPPESTADARRTLLRGKKIPARMWAWSLIAGGLGIVALVLALRILNRVVLLPQQTLPDLSKVPRLTVLPLLLMAAPVAGVVEEAAFRGYMQGPVERRSGLLIAILITGTMFAIAHLDFTLILWPYYVAVAAIYGTVTYMTKSIFPAVVLHTGGNIFSNLDLYLHGQAEWQAPSNASALIWKTGADTSFWISMTLFIVVTSAMALAYTRLARATRGD